MANVEAALSSRAELELAAGARPPSARERFRHDVLTGLAQTPRALPPVWFYDAAGSRLFQRIMRLPGYYPTRVETAILERHAGAMVAALGTGPSAIVDLGAGDGAKTRLLVAAARQRAPSVAYVPVDVAAAALRTASRQMRGTFPGLEVRTVRGDYVHGLSRACRSADEAPLLALLLGSNIGNLEWPEAIALLSALGGALRPGDHLLVGFDLLKEEALLRAAYDDPEGVTAAFNLNLLTRINRELEGDFDLGAFAHRASFDPARPAMESWLVARRELVAQVAGRRFAFRAGDALHTEISWKYTDEQVTALGRVAGLCEVARFHDERRWFADVLFRVSARAGAERA